MAMFDGIRRRVQSNLGATDRVVRVFLGVAIIGLLFAGVIPFAGLIGIIPMLVVIYLLLSGDIGFCPIYRLFHISTLKRPD
jgi:hypothetical protein